MESNWIQILLIATLCLSTNATYKSDVGNADAYVDAVLDNLRKDCDISDYINPVKLPEVNQYQCTLTNGKIWGLLNLYRNAHSSLTYYGETLKVEVGVGVKDVSLTLDYKLLYLIHGDCEFELDHLGVGLSFSSTKGNAHLNLFKVTNLGNFRVKKVTGLTTPFNWLVQTIGNIIAAVYRQNIIEALETHAANALRDILKETKLPIL